MESNDCLNHHLADNIPESLTQDCSDSASLIFNTMQSELLNVYQMCIDWNPWLNGLSITIAPLRAPLFKAKDSIFVE